MPSEGNARPPRPGPRPPADAARIGGDPSGAPAASPADDERVRWLDPADIRLRQDAHGRLFLTVRGREYAGIRIGKLFALTDPHRFVCFRDEHEVEIGVLESPAGLDDASRRLLVRQLDRKYFIPAITHINRIQEQWIDQTWDVQTDRGPRTFTVQGRDSVRFLGARTILLVDLDDNRYLIRDRHGLDSASHKWLDRFVW